MPTSGIHLADIYDFTIDGTAVAKIIDMSIDKQGTEEEIQHYDNASPNGISWRETETNGLAMNISITCYFVTAESYETFDAAWKAGTVLSPCKITTGVSGDYEEAGDFKVQNIQETGGTRTRKQYTVSLASQGAITRTIIA